MRDIHNQVTRVLAIGAVVASTTQNSAAIDLQGYDAAEILLDIGIGGITFTGVNRVDFQVTQSDDNSTYTNIADADVQGVIGTVSGFVKSLTALQAAPGVYRFGYIGNKRYLKISAVFGGTHGTGTPIAASILAARPRLAPTVAQA